MLDENHPISSNELFIIEDDCIDCYGQEIKNVLSSTEPMNAATVGQVGAAKVELCAYADEISAQASAAIDELQTDVSNISSAVDEKADETTTVKLSLAEEYFPINYMDAGTPVSISGPDDVHVVDLGPKLYALYTVSGDIEIAKFNRLSLAYNSSLLSNNNLVFNYAAPIASKRPVLSYVGGTVVRFGEFAATISSLSSNINSKLDKSSEDWTVSYTENGLHIADTAGVYYIDIAPGMVKTNYPNVHNVYWPITRGTLARLEDIAGNFSSSTAYAKDALVERFGLLYHCVNPNGHTGAWVDADFGAATVEDILAALRAGKADKPATFTAGNLATLNANGNPTDSGLSRDTVESLFFAQHYPEGKVKSAAEFTVGIKYDAPDTVNRTIMVKPFCDIDGTAENDNSSLVGRVVIPPFVDADGNGYISDDGTRFKVVGVSGGYANSDNFNLTAIFAPNTVTNIGNSAFFACASLTSVSLPATTGIGNQAFRYCSSLTSVSLPAATTIGSDAFFACASLTSVSLPVVTTIGASMFSDCYELSLVDFGNTPRSSVPSLDAFTFNAVPTTCKIIVPDEQYDTWIAADGWSDLVIAGYKFLKYSEWEYAHRYEVPKLSVDNTPANVNIVHISQKDYEQLVFDGDALSNTLYVVSGDYINAYGQ